MNWKGEWAKIETRWKAWWRGFKGQAGQAAEKTRPAVATGRLPNPSLASCWDGASAIRRMMNILSPKMAEATFEERVAWMAARGCNTAHVLLINKGDGEASGYNCATDESTAKIARARMATLRQRGFCVVPWIIADDSKAWAEDLFSHAGERVGALAAAGLFDGAGAVVMGLEMDEPGSFPGGDKGWPKVRSAIREHWAGPIGVHHCSGNSFPYASLGDIVFGQLDEGASEKSIKAQIAAIRAKGKTAFGFEYSRTADRKRAQWALDAGAAGVGNY